MASSWKNFSVETNKVEELLAEHLRADQGRLDRIEVKIDKLSETVVSLARAEEKLVGLEVSKLELKSRLDEHDDILETHEKRLNDGAVTLNTIGKLFWIAVAAGIAVALDLYLR